MKLSAQVVKYLPMTVWVIPLVFFGYVIFRYTALNGTYTYVWTPGDKSELNLLPLGRVSKALQSLETGKIFQQVTGDPVYLSVSVPRSFDSVTATVELQNQGQPLIEMGVQDSADAWHFDLHPLDVPLLENLNWSKLTDEQGNVLWQHQPTFTSIQDFLNNLPLDQRIAEYHQNLRPPFNMTNYTPAPPLDISTPLRGPQTMKLYAADQVVSLDLTVQDLNRGFDDDAVTVSLWQSGEVIAQTSILDDGNLIADGQMSLARTLHLEINDRVTGLLELQIDSTDDLLITNIKTNLGYLVARQLFLAGSHEYNSSLSFPTQATSLTTNSLALQAATSHPAALQTIVVGEESLSVLKVNSPTHVDLVDDSLRTITIPLNDVTLLSQGWMSFTPASFFDPDYQIEQLTPATQLDQIDFIYAADLPQPTLTQTRTLAFDLTQVPGDKKHLNFILSAPGLDQLKADYTVSGIRFEFHRPPLTVGGILQRIKQRLHL